LAADTHRTLVGWRPGFAAWRARGRMARRSVPAGAHQECGWPTYCLTMTAVIGLHQVAQRAVDFDRAVGFYRDVVGLELIARLDPPGLAFFRLGGTRLLLEVGAPSALLYLRVDDVAASTDELRSRGVVFESEPHVIFSDREGHFGPAGEDEVMAFFRDSEENLVALAGRQPSG
jgi:methylmalonyl-CoA/ethylmalonyl-CoA epimerase